MPNEAATKPPPRDPTAGPGSTSLSTRTKEAASLADSTSGVMHGDGLPCKPSFLEIFCGSAGLSVEVRKLGFQVLGVDNKPTAKHARAPVVNLDLRDSEQQALAYGPKSSGRMLSGWRPLVARLLLRAPYLSRAGAAVHGRFVASLVQMGCKIWPRMMRPGSPALMLCTSLRAGCFPFASSMTLFASWRTRLPA